MLDATREPLPSPAGTPLAPLPRIAGWLGRAMALGYRLAGKHRYDDFRVERVQGVPLIVTPSVFNPRVPRTGAFLASVIEAKRVGADTEVLDMGSGCGVGAVVAARCARRVVAVDLNPAAVHCTRVNALLNHLEQRIEPRIGDLFEPVAGERFDLVLFNPPFLRGAPRDDRDRAWRSTDVAERFAAELRAHLKPGGCALVLLSTFGKASVFLEQFRKYDLATSLFAERGFLNERLAIFRLEPSSRGEPA